MSRRKELTPDQEQALIGIYREWQSTRRGSFDAVVTSFMRTQGVNLCEDTLRRKLVLLGEIEPVGAKYVPTSKSTWTRACLGCGKPERRPRNIYFCTACQERLRRQGDY